MNTFLPRGADYLRGARELDDRRLQKQLVEVQQIHMALTTGSPAHILHHPATQAWLGMEQALLEYGLACYGNWLGRTVQLRPPHKSGVYILKHLSPQEQDVPPWLTGTAQDILAQSHRTKLYLKDPTRYGPFGYWTGSVEGPLALYPVVDTARKHIGWVYRHENERRWRVNVDPRTFPTAWAGIQYLRENTHG